MEQANGVKQPWRVTWIRAGVALGVLLAGCVAIELIMLTRGDAAPLGEFAALCAIVIAPSIFYAVTIGLRMDRWWTRRGFWYALRKHLVAVFWMSFPMAMFQMGVSLSMEGIFANPEPVDAAEFQDNDGPNGLVLIFAAPFYVTFAAALAAIAGLVPGSFPSQQPAPVHTPTEG